MHKGGGLMTAVAIWSTTVLGIFVFDTRGRLRLYVSAETSVDTLVHDLKVLFRE